MCAVVKANGYGHGAGERARSAQAAAPPMLAVATAGEAGRSAPEFADAPILVMGALAGRRARPGAGRRAPSCRSGASASASSLGASRATRESRRAST